MYQDVCVKGVFCGDKVHREVAYGFDGKPVRIESLKPYRKGASSFLRVLYSGTNLVAKSYRNPCGGIIGIVRGEVHPDWSGFTVVGKTSSVLFLEPSYMFPRG